MQKNRTAFDSLLYPALFVGILWTVKIVEITLKLDLSIYGIEPRTKSGLLGILVAPLIHGSTIAYPYTHLLSNTLPLLILGILVFNFYRSIAFELFNWIYLGSNCCIWIIGEDAYHIGASGLIYGFASFIFFSGLFRRKFTALVLAVLVASVYGSIIWGIFPIHHGISWQGHLYGAMVGALCGFFYRDVE